MDHLSQLLSKRGGESPLHSCGICERKVDKLFKHHITPVVKGGRNGDTVMCCRTCANQIHMLYSEWELSKMTLQELISTESMQKYISWIKNRKGEHKIRMSNRIKKR